jgi:hypothetical protein
MAHSFAGAALTLSAVFFMANPITARDAGSNETPLTQITSVDEISNLVNARDAAFEANRQRVFASTESTQALGAWARLKDVDAVDKFVTSVLYRWSSGAVPSDEALHRFLTEELPRTRAANRSAAGLRGSSAILEHLAGYANQNEALDFLFVQALMLPRDRAEVHDALMRYFKRRPVSQPQVWLRITQELNDPRLLDATIKYTLASTDKPLLLAALNAEKLRSQRAAQPFAPELEALRKQLAN